MRQLLSPDSEPQHARELQVDKCEFKFKFEPRIAGGNFKLVPTLT